MGSGERHLILGWGVEAQSDICGCLHYHPGVQRWNHNRRIFVIDCNIAFGPSFIAVRIGPFHARESETMGTMATLGLIEYEAASPEVRAVYDDIMTTRKIDSVNNFWKALAHDPATLRRTWQSIKEIMAPGALDPLTKEMLYVAVSVTNQCGYCIASHAAAARKAGMTDAMFAELMAVVGMANETNRLASGYQVEIDERFLKPKSK
jgi:AhpD family alkylhydroperoxidase